ncbi:MAG: hypothetical protein U9R79_03205 [Armatimonadota bacterium]|nr:hypothetical protein [Armatimonadota bacterium]
MVQIEFTSRTDSEQLAGFLPSYTFTPIVERLLLVAALSADGSGELQAQVRPASVAGSDQAIAFGAFLDDGSLLGVIDPDCALVRAAINDVWAEVVGVHDRPADDIADYRLVICDEADHEPSGPSGIRLLGEEPSPWRHSIRIPPVVEIDLNAGVCLGQPAELFVRVFAATVLERVLDFVGADVDTERMGVLHGQLALTPVGTKHLPIVIYDDFTPLVGESTSGSVHVSADAQETTAQSPTAAIIHSHPVAALPEEQHDDAESGPVRGPADLSPVDLRQLRQGLPHAHQASWVASLPATRDERVLLTAFGYSRPGVVSAEGGFWVVGDEHLPPVREAATSADPVPKESVTS